MKKVWQNYVTDVVIGLAFVVSSISGLAFLVPGTWVVPSASGAPAFLGLNYSLWSDLHTYSSLVMVAGVLLHLVLHARWIWSMTCRLLKRPARRASSCPSPCPAPQNAQPACDA